MALEYPRDMLARLIEGKTFNLTASEQAAIYVLVDTVFFASLMIEEGSQVRVAVVHDANGAAGLADVPDESPGGDASPAWDVTVIARRAFDAPTLAKLSRGIEYGSQLVVVGGTGTELWIDGVARRQRRTDGGRVTRIAAPRPGVLVFEQHFDQALRFEAGQQVTPPIDVLGSDGPVRTAIGAITGEPGELSPEATKIEGHPFYSHPESALHHLVRKMRATGAGALLALLPVEPGEDVLEAVRYRRVDVRLFANRIQANKILTSAWLGAKIATHDETLRSEQVRARDEAQIAAKLAEEALEDAIDDVAQLSAIDGAVLGGPGLAIYGAGYLIPTVQLPPGTVQRALDSSGDVMQRYVARHGARHGAAFSFAYENPGAVAFIVSEDGPVSCALRVGDQVKVWSVEVLET